jgi:ATP-dependent Clp protease ATP-binding subunit ClpB
VAAKYSHQTVESEHLLAALLEQSNGLARRILQKCNADPSSVLNRIDSDLRKAPKVSGTSDQVLGRNLEALITAAEAMKVEWKDEYVSVEHLMIAAADDTAYGAGLCKAFGVTKAKLQQAVKDIRGSKRVTGTLLRTLQRSCTKQPRSAVCHHDVCAISLESC